MLDHLKPIIKELVETNPSGYSNTLRFKYPELCQYLKDTYPSRGEGLYCWLYDAQPPMCLECKQVQCEFNSIHNGGYRQFCSCSCRAKYNKSYKNAHNADGSLKQSIRAKNSEKAPVSLSKRLTTYKATHGKDMWEANTKMRLDKYLDGFPADLKSREFCSNTMHTWTELAEMYNVPFCTIRNVFKMHQIKPKFRGKQYSAAEMRVGELLTSMGIEYERSVRTILSNRREIDIYIPSLKLGIEYCGLFWHSDRNNYSPSKHQEKFIDARDKGIKLITLFEDEWLHKQAIVISRLTALTKQNVRVFARKCTTDVVETKLATQCLNGWHIQGARSGAHNFSLLHDGEVVAVLTYGKPRYGNEDVEIIRYATKPGITVVGGFSKLLKRVVLATNATTVVSYSDNRWGDGNVYKQAGMENRGITQPSYFYFLPAERKRYHRSAFMKHKIVNQMGGDASMTEVENMRAFGYNRIFDCGTTKWVLTVNPVAS